MTRIYEALKRAERKGKAAGSAVVMPAPDGPAAPRTGKPLHEKLIAVYRGIVAALPDASCRVVAFVGAHAGAGTSTLAREFVKVASQELGKRAALVDAERGQGGHYDHFGARLDCTWEEVLSSEGAAGEAVQPVWGELLYLGCLSTNGTSSTVLTQPGFKGTLDVLRERFDLVVFDVPPGLDSSQALLLAPHCDGVVLVIEAEKTRWQVAESLRERVTTQGGRVLGVVLNKRKYYIPRFIYKRL